MTNLVNKNRSGFTLIELMVTMGILATLFAITSISFSNFVPNISQDLTFDKIVNDIRAQQTLAMSNSYNYGIHFESNSYTLFKGPSYAAGEDMLIVPLDDAVSIVNITIPGDQITFASASGDFVGHSPGNDSFTLVNSVSDKNSVVKINKYGATY